MKVETDVVLFFNIDAVLIVSSDGRICWSLVPQMARISYMSPQPTYCSARYVGAFFGAVPFITLW